MANLLLSLILVLAQLFSWGAAPVYLCACGSGSVCIDTGPNDCDCCHEATDAQLDGQAVTHEHQHDEALATTLSLPCDCQHVELSVWGGPAVANSSNESAVAKLTALPLAVIVTLATDLAGQTCSTANLFHGAGPTNFMSAILSTVVLRC